MDAAVRTLGEKVVPQVSQAPGFVTGYWTRKGTTGLSMIILESEEDANRMSELVPSLVDDAVTLEDVEVREVVSNA